MIRWEAPGPYVVGFTSREGGVSTGAYASLNLGARADEPERIAENRRLACAELGLDAGRLAVNTPAAHGDRSSRAPRRAARDRRRALD